MRNSFYLLILLFILSCNQDYAPKPRGYHRIELPQKTYLLYSSSCPFEFKYPTYSYISKIDNVKNNCWLDIIYPQFNGRIHLTYQSVNSAKEINKLTEDARTLAYKNVVKASEINDFIFEFPEKKVYGLYYDIVGNTASSVQFYLTDSSKHYVRGALYFNEQPNLDSIKPVLDFVIKDIDIMIKSFKWSN